MKLSKTIKLSASINESILLFSKSVNMSEIEVFMLTLLKMSKEAGDFRTISELLSGEFGFNESLVKFYAEEVMRHLINTGSISVADLSVDLGELIVAEIELNKAIEKSITNNTFKTSEVKRNKKKVTFVLDPITNKLEVSDSFEKGEASITYRPQPISELKLSGAKERWIEQESKEIFICEDFTESSTKVVSLPVSIDVSFNIGAITLDENLGEFISQNKMTQEFFDFMFGDFPKWERQSNFEYVDSGELIDALSKKVIDGITVVDKEVFKLGSRYFEPKNFTGLKILVPAYKKFSFKEYIVGMSNEDLFRFAKMWELEQDMKNEMIKNRVIDSKTYKQIKNLLSADDHVKVLAKFPNLVDDSNLSIYLKTGISLEKLLGLIKKNKLNIFEIDFREFGEEAWDKIELIAKQAGLTKEVRNIFSTEKVISELKVSLSSLDSAKDIRKNYNESVSIVEKTIKISAYPFAKTFNKHYEKFIILEKDEMKREAKALAGELRERFEKTLKSFKSSEIGWVSSNLNRIDGPTLKESKYMWKLANKFHHLVEEVTKDDLNKLNSALDKTSNLKVKKAGKNVS